RRPACRSPPSGRSSSLTIVDALLRRVYDRDIAFRTEGETAFGPFIGADVVELCGGAVVGGEGGPGTAGKIAARAKAKRLVLTHFKPTTAAILTEIEADVKKDYAGPLALSRDLDTFDI